MVRNDDFEGGCTTFFTPKPGEEGTLHSRPTETWVELPNLSWIFLEHRGVFPEDLSRNTSLIRLELRVLTIDVWMRMYDFVILSACVGLKAWDLPIKEFPNQDWMVSEWSARTRCGYWFVVQLSVTHLSPFDDADIRDEWSKTDHTSLNQSEP